MKVNIGKYPKGDKERKVNITIHPYDTWSMDHTLALIILPMLKQLKKTKHGSPFVDDTDLPEHMRKGSHSDWDSQYTFDWYQEDNTDQYKPNMHDKWDWVLDEMIWAFKQVVKDDDSKFYDHSECDKKTSIIEQVKCIKVDREGLDQYHARIKNGLRLFGRYYQNLWD